MPSASEIRSSVESLFDVIRDRGTADELVFLCPEPGCGDQTGNRSVNLRNGKTSCWRCNKGGNFAAWAKRLGYEVDYSHTPAPTASEIDGLLDQVAAIHRPVATGYVPSVKLPHGFTPLRDKPKCSYAQLIGEMAVRKRLTFQDFSDAGVGFTRDNPKWEPFAIFPIFEWGRPVYYQGRTYTDPVEGSTKRFPNKHECPLGARYWVYGIDELRAKPGQVAVVVEAILNVLSLRCELARRGITGVVPVAIFKHKISAEQQQKILGCRPGEVCMMFDGDAAASALADASYLVNGCKTSTVDMPSGKDPNDDAVLSVDLFVKSRKMFNRFSSLTI